ncbi:MAG: sugar phosphate nucleotidyltransferase [Acidimicrobiia bacterium]|nr:sugar phosphate nucleotidyltransferase [Acidimicrobiia bacterium]
MTVVPVILAGGTGSRLWPVSRSASPKPLHAFGSGEPLIVETAARIEVGGSTWSMVVCGADLLGPIRTLLGSEMRYLVEPAGRDTAPAVAAAALALHSQDPDTVMVVLPSDHRIADVDTFRKRLGAAVELAEEGYLVTFGIVPDRPETGYGYIAPAEHTGEGHLVERFVEKPDESTAARYVADGYLWNSGMFVFRADRMIAEMGELQPAVLDAARRSVGTSDADVLYLGAAFLDAPRISLDHAVMEHTTRAAMIPLDCGWSDLGTWQAVWEHGDMDDAGNVLLGRTIALNTSNSLVWSSGRLVASVGLEGIAVVETPDAVLVVDRRNSQDVKAAVDLIGEVPEAKEQLAEGAGWGRQLPLERGQRFSVDRYDVEAGGTLPWRRACECVPYVRVLAGEADLGPACGRFKAGETVPVTFEDSISIANPSEHRLSVLVVVVCTEDG